MKTQNGFKKQNRIKFGLKHGKGAIFYYDFCYLPSEYSNHWGVKSCPLQACVTSCESHTYSSLSTTTDASGTHSTLGRWIIDCLPSHITNNILCWKHDVVTNELKIKLFKHTSTLKYLAGTNNRNLPVVDVNSWTVAWGEISINACGNDEVREFTSLLSKQTKGRAFDRWICSIWCHLFCFTQSFIIFRTLVVLNTSAVLCTFIKIKGIAENREK